MKLSQPKSARIINTCRVLCELRKTDKLSKSELARILELNKVSSGEIVTDLISKGLVKETGKLAVTNGRRPTTLQIVKDSRYVLCVNIGSRNICVALCNLLGETIKLERFPCETNLIAEEFCAHLLKSCIRTVKLISSEQMLGVGITVSGKISIDEKTIISCPYLPWTNITLADVFEKVLGYTTLICPSVAALVSAEKIRNPKALTNPESTVYLDWGDHISMAIVSNSLIAGINPDFGHLKIGFRTLEESCASWAISSTSVADKLKNLWDDIPEESLETMAKALNLTKQVTGANKVIFGGESASIDSSCLNRIRRECNGLTLEQSLLGDKADILATAEFALDRFFYQNSLLDEVRPWI